jgi:hypothetical protein
MVSDKDWDKDDWLWRDNQLMAVSCRRAAHVHVATRREFLALCADARLVDRDGRLTDHSAHPFSFANIHAPWSSRLRWWADKWRLSAASWGSISNFELPTEEHDAGEPSPWLTIPTKGQARLDLQFYRPTITESSAVERCVAFTEVMLTQSRSGRTKRHSQEKKLYLETRFRECDWADSDSFMEALMAHMPSNHPFVVRLKQMKDRRRTETRDLMTGSHTVVSLDESDVEAQ